MTFDAEGESKNSSIVIDLNDRQLQRLFKLMVAAEIVIDYGISGARLRIERRMLTPDGEGDIAKFYRGLCSQRSFPLNSRRQGRRL